MKYLVMIVLALSLVGCGKEAQVPTLPDPTPDQEMYASEKGLSLMLDRVVFNEPPTFIDTVVRNDSARDYRYGEFYHIEMRVNSLWHMITYSDAVFIKNQRFRDFGSILRSGEEAHQRFSVEELGVTLLPDDYRLVKSFLAQGEPFHEISVAVPFLVE